MTTYELEFLSPEFEDWCVIGKQRSLKMIEETLELEIAKDKAAKEDYEYRIVEVTKRVIKHELNNITDLPKRIITV